MADYEIAVRKWAVAKAAAKYPWYDCRWLDVDVIIEGEPGTADYSSLTGGDPPDFGVKVTGGGRTAELIDLDDGKISFDQLLGEILAVEVTDDDRQIWKERHASQGA